MSSLSSGAVAALVICCTIATSVLTGALAFWLGHRSTRLKKKGPKPVTKPIKYALNHLKEEIHLHVIEHTWFSSLVEELISDISMMIGSLDFEFHARVPANVIAALKVAVPCDGLADADWPLWERLLMGNGWEDGMDFFHPQFLAREALQCVVTHWLVYKMQPDCDEATSLLRPDLLSLRKSIMAKPKFNKSRRAVQQMWTFFTACLVYTEPPRTTIWNLPAPPDSRAEAAARAREELYRLLEPMISPVQGLRGSFNMSLDSVIGHACELAILMFCSFEGEAEFFWVDPKTMPWPRSAEDREKEDDQFIIRFPGIRRQMGTPGDDLDDEEVGPQQLPPPEQSWIPVQWKESWSLVPSALSIHYKLLRDRRYPP